MRLSFLQYQTYLSFMALFHNVKLARSRDIFIHDLWFNNLIVWINSIKIPSNVAAKTSASVFISKICAEGRKGGRKAEAGRGWLSSVTCTTASHLCFYETGNSCAIGSCAVGSCHSQVPMQEEDGGWVVGRGGRGELKFPCEVGCWESWLSVAIRKCRKEKL